MSIQQITTDQLRRMEGKEGLILQGCGGSLLDWQVLRQRTEHREVLQAAAYFKRMRTSYASSGRSFACQPFNHINYFFHIKYPSISLSCKTIGDFPKILTIYSVSV